MNGCRVGSRGAHHALRVVLDPDDVSACRRRVKRHGSRVAVLGDRIRHTTTVGAKTLLPLAMSKNVLKLPVVIVCVMVKVLLPAGAVTDTQ